ncbi:hypothetical protein QOT17_011523 [Balamuthia mandrillaris]
MCLLWNLRKALLFTANTGWDQTLVNTAFCRFVGRSRIFLTLYSLDGGVAVRDNKAGRWVFCYRR